MTNSAGGRWCNKCKKVVFPSRRAAEQFIAKWKARRDPGAKRPTHAYSGPRCGKWHVLSRAEVLETV